ncbi:MAG: tetratricopeptide repeat protein [Myxococcota bacterium]
MRVLRIALSLLVAFALLGLPIAASAAGGGGGGGDYGGSVGSSSSRSSRSPESIARRHYQAGLRAKAKAWKYEEKAAKKEDPKDREKLLAQAQKAYAAAIRSQTAAVKALPKHYEAQNELGYALRRTGKYPEAIAAYDRALEINSAYFPAIEYRGEAYLGIGELEKVKSAYMVLFRNERALADQLMKAMDAWVVQQPAGEATAAFAEWVQERKALAQAGDDLSLNNTRRW